MPDRIPTLAEVCSAIAEGRLSVSSDGSTYQVSARELRRYFSNYSSLPTFPYTDIDPLLLAEHTDLSASNFCSMGL
jgi:hypothetical protein